ncbi:MAG: hypothetical protein ACXWQO_04255 [Bdellovibrionota bacterium]
MSLHENFAPIEAQRETIVRNVEPEAFIDLPRGGLVEISGPNARREVAALLAANPEQAVVWIERTLEPFPADLERMRLNFERVLFVHGDSDSSWAASAVLRTGLFPLVVFSAGYSNERELRRYLRQAKQTNATFLVISERPTPSTLFSVQLLAGKNGLELLRRRFS